MYAEKTEIKPGLLGSVLANKCPHCRKGNLFINPNPYNLKTTMTMPEACPVCGQKFELQTGFYFGTGYVSYAITVVLCVVTFTIWWLTIGMHGYKLFWWLGVNAVVLILLQPVIQRLARSIWIALFVKYEPQSRI